jgi:thiol-disulfide isomerase/thioredoxin
MTSRDATNFLAGLLICWFFLGVPLKLSADDRRPFEVQSISIEKMDAVIRRAGDCLVVVMAAWCHPCIEELPALKALNQKYARKGLRMVGLSLDYGGPQAMEPLLKAQQIHFPVYWTGEAAIEKYAITKIPLLIFFRDGRVVQRLQGQRSRAALEKEIVRFLKDA